MAGSSPYVKVKIIGNLLGGVFFSFFGGSYGRMMNKIRVSAGKWEITAVKIWMTDGTSAQFGKPFGLHKEFSFQPGELIKSMSLWGNGTGKRFSWPSKKNARLGAIKFKTNKGNEFFTKMTARSLNQENRNLIDVGSGVCVGVMGRHGDGIDRIGFQFIKPLMESRMIDIDYPSIGSEKANVRMTDLKSMTYNNRLDSEQTFSLAVTDTISKRQNWSVTGGLESVCNVSVTAGIPEVFSTTAGWELKVSVSGTYETENTKTKEETWNFPVTVPPKTKVLASISIGKADINIPYTGNIVMTTTDGSELTYAVKGTYTGVSYTNVMVDIKKE